MSLNTNSVVFDNVVIYVTTAKYCIVSIKIHSNTLYLSLNSTKSIIIPISLIDYYQNAFDLSQNKLVLHFKNLKIIVLEFQTLDTLLQFTSLLDKISSQKPIALPLSNQRSNSFGCDIWACIPFSQNFSYVNINLDKKICPTYPETLIIPSNISQSIVCEAAKFRRNGRFPILCYVNSDTKALLLRSSESLTGLANEHSKCDEQYLNTFLHCEGRHVRGYIIDTRTPTVIQDAKLYGGGSEHESRYPQWKKVYLGLDSAIFQSSFEKFVSNCLKSATISSDKWVSSLDSCQWLQHIYGLLSGAKTIAELLTSKSSSILIHNGLGLDCTLQITSLVQILLEPKCRTISGFLDLIYREWIEAGHPFATRCRSGPFSPQHHVNLKIDNLHFHLKTNNCDIADKHDKGIVVSDNYCNAQFYDSKDEKGNNINTHCNVNAIPNEAFATLSNWFFAFNISCLQSNTHLCENNDKNFVEQNNDSTIDSAFESRNLNSKIDQISQNPDPQEICNTVNLESLIDIESTTMETQKTMTYDQTSDNFESRQQNINTTNFAQNSMVDEGDMENFVEISPDFTTSRNVKDCKNNFCQETPTLTQDKEHTLTNFEGCLLQGGSSESIHSIFTDLTLDQTYVGQKCLNLLNVEYDELNYSLETNSDTDNLQASKEENISTLEENNGDISAQQSMGNENLYADVVTTVGETSVNTPVNTEDILVTNSTFYTERLIMNNADTNIVDDNFIKDIISNDNSRKEKTNITENLNTNISDFNQNFDSKQNKNTLDINQQNMEKKTVINEKSRPVITPQRVLPMYQGLGIVSTNKLKSKNVPDMSGMGTKSSLFNRARQNIIQTWKNNSNLIQNAASNLANAYNTNLITNNFNEHINFNNNINKVQNDVNHNLNVNNKNTLKNGERNVLTPSAPDNMGLVVPSFLLFIETVLQIMYQYPTAFEFNRLFPIFLFNYAYAGLLTELFQFRENGVYRFIGNDVFKDKFQNYFYQQWESTFLDISTDPQIIQINQELYSNLWNFESCTSTESSQVIKVKPTSQMVEESEEQILNRKMQEAIQLEFELEAKIKFIEKCL